MHKSSNSWKTAWRLPRALKRDRRGVTAAEFALVSPFVFLMLFGIFEFSRAMFTWGVLNYAAQQATRFATVNYNATTQQIRDVAEDAFILVDSGNISDFSVSAPLNPSDQTRLVTVEIGYDYGFSLPYINLGSMRMRGDSKGFLVEQ